uniref:hypothetical protein n=1 Tax=Algoriphagus sp. TaxID=1872435 RepID=UPI0040476232
MHYYPIELVDGHAILISGTDRILVDTGSPISIHASPILRLMERDFSCATQYAGVSSGSLTELLGSPITTLLGMDILSKFIVMFDYPNHRIGFSTTDSPSKGIEIPIRQHRGIPIVEAEVLGSKHQFFLDSGAKLSYLVASITEGLPSQETKSDFYPGYGSFETPIFTLETQIAGATLSINFGNLPTQLLGLLNQGNVKGIIGFDLFNHFQILLNIQQNKLQFL